jgi:hypothetical protein
VAECESNYRQMLANNGLIGEEDTDIDSADRLQTAGFIAEIRTAVISGNTWYYFRLTPGGDTYFAISAAADQNVVILNQGDYVEVTFAEGQGGIFNAYSVVKTEAPAAAPAA